MLLFKTNSILSTDSFNWTISSGVKPSNGSSSSSLRLAGGRSREDVEGAAATIFPQSTKTILLPPERFQRSLLSFPLLLFSSPLLFRALHCKVAEIREETEDAKDENAIFRQKRSIFACFYIHFHVRRAARTIFNVSFRDFFRFSSSFFIVFVFSGGYRSSTAEKDDDKADALGKESGENLVIIPVFFVVTIVVVNSNALCRTDPRLLRRRREESIVLSDPNSPTVFISNNLCCSVLCGCCFAYFSSSAFEF